MHHVPAAIEQFQTTMRDPMFYQLYTRFMRFFLRFKDNLPSYTKSELFFQGVKVENVVFTPLTTFMEEFDFDITAGTVMSKEEIDAKKEKMVFVARQLRLNHKPFSVNVDIMSDKDTDVSVRIFMGPKYDNFGRVINIDDNKYNFVELDHFIYNLKSGKNVVTRKNVDFSRCVVDRTKTRFLYNKVMNGLTGNGEFRLDMTEAHNGWPLRLLLPKGRMGGMKFQVFVIVTPFRQAKVPYGTGFPQQYTGGVGTGSRFYEDLPFGFPLDRPIDESIFFVPNMFMTDVVIFHSRDYVMNNVVGGFVKKDYMGKNMGVNTDMNTDIGMGMDMDTNTGMNMDVNSGINSNMDSGVNYEHFSNYNRDYYGNVNMNNKNF